MADISSGSWSTSDAANNQNSPLGWNSSTTQSQTIPIGQATMGAIKRLWERQGAARTATGSAGNYVVTPTNPLYPTALVQGDTIGFIANHTNPGAGTLAYNGLSPIPIRKAGTSGPTALTGNEIQPNQLVVGSYDGVALQLISQTATTTSASVTSVAMTGDGTVFNAAVTGSPVTSSGTLAPSLKPQAINRVLASPASGSAAVPTFRTLGLTDLPAQTGTGNIVLATAPTLTNPVVGTQSPGDNTTKAASTAFVTTAVAGGGAGGKTSWTPALNFGAASVGMSYASQIGTYVVNGNVVVAEFNIVLSAKGSSTGNATITGLPVAANATAVVTISGYQNMASISLPIVSNYSGTTVTLAFGGTTGQTSNLTEANFTDTTLFIGSIIYIKA